MNLYDAFRLLSESKGKLSKSKSIKRETPSIEVEAAVLLAYTETAIRQQTPCVYCTIDFLSSKLGVCDKRIRLAKKHLAELGFVKDQFIGFKAYVQLLYYIPELKGKKASRPPLTREPTPGATGDGDPGIFTPGITGETNTHSLEVNTHSLDLATKTKTTLTCMGDREKVLEEERQIADGKNQIARNEEMSDGDLSSIAPASRSLAGVDSQMADGKGKKEKLTREEFVQWLADWFQTDIEDPAVVAWVNYESLYGNYVRIDYDRYQKVLEAKTDYRQQELDFAKLLSIIQPTEHNKRLRQLWGNISRSPGFDLSPDIIWAIDFLRAYADMETILMNWSMVEQLSPLIIAKICNNIELFEHKPTFKDIKELFNYAIDEDKKSIYK